MNWRKIPVQINHTCDKSVSVIVVYRNEEDNLITLLDSLKRQVYPEQLIEYIFINDHSDDESFNIVESQIGAMKDKVQHHQLPEGKFGKKNGIAHGVKCSKNDWILTTDADCTFSESWIASMSNTKDSAFVSGPVVFEGANNLWGKLVELDFISLITIGGALINRGEPVLANGANMFYSKAMFNQVRGYGDNTHIASGDDVFLLEKISKESGSNIQFNKDKEALVQTKLPSSLKDFFQQRVRWAKKTQFAADTKTNKTLMALLLFYVLLLISVVAACFIDTKAFLLSVSFVVLFKVIIDVYFFKQVLPFFNKSRLLPYVVIVDFLHPFYMIIIAVLSSLQPVKWKKRVHKYG